MNNPDKRQRKFFISYRRDDNPDFAKRIRDWFVFRHQRENVYMDFDSIGSAVKFREVIREKVQECDVLIAVIGPDWSNLLARKLIRPNEEDFVVIEIELALELKKLIVPILIKEAELPLKDFIPQRIQEMFEYNAVRLDSDETFYDRIQRILMDVESELIKRDSQLEEIRKLDEISPAAGIALAYYINFVQRFVTSLKAQEQGMYRNRLEFIDDDGIEQKVVQLGQTPEDRENIKLNIIIVSQLRYLDDKYLAIVKKELRVATIETQGRPLSMFGRYHRGSYDMVDFANTLKVIDYWVQRRLKLAGGNTNSLELEKQESDRFELMLNWLIENEDNKEDFRRHIRVLKYDPRYVVDELTWLHQLWSD